jgi:hypothetical protein
MHTLKQIAAIRREFATTSPRFAMICSDLPRLIRSDSPRIRCDSQRFAATSTRIRRDSPRFAAMRGESQQIATNRSELCMY